MSERPKPPQNVEEVPHPTIDEMIEQDILPNSLAMNQKYGEISIFENHEFQGYMDDFTQYLQRWFAKKAAPYLHTEEKNN